MPLRRAAIIAAWVLAVAAGPAAAQWPQQQQQQAPWPQQQAPLNGPSPMAQPPMQQPGSSPWGAPPQQQQQQEAPPCIKAFLKLRDEASKKADAIRAASEHHAPAQEACALFNAFFAAELKMIKYAAEQGASCGIPPEVSVNLKKGHARTTDIRAKVCQAAARPAQPAAPSLSDALTAPVADSKNIKSGGGTFDTLSGSPLGPK